MNPFATCFVRPDRNRYRFATDVERDACHRDAFLTRLFFALNRSRRAAIVGPHGTGKTTLLRTLEVPLREHFAHLDVVTLSSARRTSYRELMQPWETQRDQAESTRCLIVDGYEQLRWWDRLALWWRFQRRPQWSLIITTHRRPWGFPVCIQTGFDLEISRMLTREKLTEVPATVREKLFGRFEDRLRQLSGATPNLRDLWFTMYDEYEVMKAPTDAATNRQTQ